MAGNELYIGKIMSSMIEAMEGVVENTQWLKNLYNSNGLRATKSFSSSDGSLKSNASTTGGFTAGTLTNSTLSFGSSGLILTTTMPSAVCMGSASKIIVLPSNADKMKFTFTLSTLQYGTRSFSVDGVEQTPGTNVVVNLTEAQKAAGYITLSLSVVKNTTSSGTNTVNLNNFKIFDATDALLMCYILPTSNYTADAVLTIAAGQTEALLILNKLSGITASKLDLFNMAAVQNGGNIKVGFTDGVSLVGMFNIGDSDWIGDFNSLSFDIYIYISRALTTDPSPTVSAIAIRYLQ